MIPFNKPCRVGNEEQYVIDVVNTGKLSFGGVYSEKCESFLSDYYGTKTLLTSSCTHALELCAIALKELNETKKTILVPSFAYVSTVNAFHLHGFNIIFADVDDAGNLSLDSLMEIDLSDVLAVVVLHYGGVTTEIKALSSFLKERSVYLIEDNAIGFGALEEGVKLGTFGDLSTLSFHETKVLTCGEGGALIVNNQDFLKTIEIARYKGTNREDFNHGLVDKYNWVGKGSAFLPSELQASYLYGQLKVYNKIIEYRKKLWTLYYTSLRELEDVFGLPKVHLTAEHNASVFYLIISSQKERKQLISFLEREGVMAVFHYQPLHQSPYVRANFTQDFSCPNSEELSCRILRLPLFYNMNVEELNHVVGCILKFYNRQS